jgi:Tfp pilus assembly protein PilN
MKIATNFVRPIQRAAIPVAAVFWLMSLAFAVSAWWLLDDASVLRGELPDLRQRLARINATGHTPAVQPVQLPSVQELAETRNRVARINAAVRTKGMPTLSLLADLEAMLPPEVWLASFHYRAAEGEVLLTASAASADLLSGFLLKLERDPLFEQAMLVRELQASGTGKAGIVQFEIRLKVRSS